MKNKGTDFWVGRFSVEIAVALTALELGNEDLARAGLRECLDDFLDSPDSSQELLDYLDDMHRERQQAQAPMPILRKPQPTADQIANRL